MGPEYLELVTDIRTVINYGKYSSQVISDSPDWEGKEGETLFRYQANGTGFFYYQYFWVNSGWSFLRWLGSSNVLVVDNSSLTYDQINPSSNITRCITGAYQGNGGTTQAFTGVGFKPKAIMISPIDATSLGNYDKTDAMGTSYAKYTDAAATVYQADLVTIDADGFTVGDGTGGSGENPNENLKYFAYTIWG